ncbi:MAG: CoA transferase [Pseudomonadota bacterium]
MSPSSHTLLQPLWAALGGDAAAAAAVRFTGPGALPSAFHTTDLAAASMAAAGLAVAELRAQAGTGGPAAVAVDRRLASVWFGTSIRPVGWQMPSPWDPIAGDYAVRDGWVRLHTNAPHHRAAAERVLGRHADRQGMAGATAGWTKLALETAVVGAGGCAAAMHTQEEWARHPQGQALAAEPLVHWAATDAARCSGWAPRADRPLAGLRVLDLTRVLAGPVGSRFLAGYGAEVLRIDPPDWDEPGVVPEVTLGKRCARLDLRSPAGRAVLEELLSSADVLLHGYRGDALERLGLGTAWRRRVAPGLVDVCHDAYGWSGPWALRRGFDSLVQMSCGIAHAGMAWRGATTPVQAPVPLPVQALDQATGYLVAAAAVRGLTRRLQAGTGQQARLSLARTAAFLVEQGRADAEPAFAPESGADLAPGIEATAWGDARRVAWPVSVVGAPARWELPAAALGSSPACWA